jgi:hypothetical protein
MVSLPVCAGKRSDAVKLTSEYWQDKAFDIVIAAPIGTAMSFALARVWGWLTFDAVVIGGLVFVSLCGVVEFIRWERRRNRRAIGLRGVFLSHAAKLRNAAPDNATELMAHAAASIRASLGEYETKYFWQEVSQSPTAKHPNAAAAYLEALAERANLEPYEPPSAFLIG